LKKEIYGDQVRQDASKLQHEIDKDDRAYGFDLSGLLVEKQADMSTTDVRKVLYLRNILIAALRQTKASPSSRKWLTCPLTWLRWLGIPSSCIGPSTHGQETEPRSIVRTTWR
jgi:hypothetical protein